MIINLILNKSLKNYSNTKQQYNLILLDNYVYLITSNISVRSKDYIFQKFYRIQDGYINNKLLLLLSNKKFNNEELNFLYKKIKTKINNISCKYKISPYDIVNTENNNIVWVHKDLGIFISKLLSNELHDNLLKWIKDIEKY